MIGFLLTLLCMILPLAAAPFVFQRAKGQRVERVLMSLMPLGAGLAVWVVAFTISIVTVDDWSGAKMAPIVAMVRGSPHYALYQDPTHGVMTGWIYGPVPALLLLPAAVFSTPTHIILTGNLLNMLWALLPALWLCAQGARGADGKIRWSDTLLASGVFLWICLPAESMTRSIFMAGADGPALGLAACSCALLARDRNPLRLALAALCAVLAVWSKQSLAPFLLAAPIYIWIADGIRSAGRFLLILLITLIVVSAILIAAFGGHNMWFHMVTLPSSHPWQHPELGKPLDLLRAGGDLLSACANAIGIFLFVLAVQWAFGDSSLRPMLQNWRRWIAQNPWLLLLLVALLAAPGAMIGYIKLGGWVNNLGLSQYFLTLAATVWAAQLVARSSRPILSSLLRCGMCLVILAQALMPVFWNGKMPELTRAIASIYDNHAETAWRFDRQYPGLAYFPRDPLPALLAEGKLYHFEWGMIDRVMANMQDMAQFQAHMPSSMVLVAYPTNMQSNMVLQMLPSAVDRGPYALLPGYTVYSDPSILLPGTTR